MEETSHPVLAAVAFLATLIFGPPNEENAMTSVPPVSLPDLITVDPNPMVAGQQAKLCYDFQPGGPDTVTLRITWNLKVGEDSEDVTLTRKAPCKNISVPADGESVNIEDLTAHSSDYGGAIA